MVRLTGQLKGILALICSLGASLAFSFVSRRYDQPHGSWGVPACIGLAFFVSQLVLVPVKTREEAELAEFKRIQSAENEKSAVEIESLTKTANAVSEQLLAAIQSGNIEQAEQWSAFRRKLYGK